MGRAGRRLLREARMAAETEKWKGGEILKRCYRQDLAMTVVHTRVRVVHVWWPGQWGWPP